MKSNSKFAVPVKIVNARGNSDSRLEINELGQVLPGCIEESTSLAELQNLRQRLLKRLNDCARDDSISGSGSFGGTGTNDDADGGELEEGELEEGEMEEGELEEVEPEAQNVVNKINIAEKLGEFEKKQSAASNIRHVDGSFALQHQSQSSKKRSRGKMYHEGFGHLRDSDMHSFKRSKISLYNESVHTTKDKYKWTVREKPVKNASNEFDRLLDSYQYSQQRADSRRYAAPTDRDNSGRSVSPDCRQTKKRSRESSFRPETAEPHKGDPRKSQTVMEHDKLSPDQNTHVCTTSATTVQAMPSAINDRRNGNGVNKEVFPKTPHSLGKLFSRSKASFAVDC